jgi:hypothetical protein
MGFSSLRKASSAQEKIMADRASGSHLDASRSCAVQIDGNPYGLYLTCQFSGPKFVHTNLGIKIARAKVFGVIGALDEWEKACKEFLMSHGAKGSLTRHDLSKLLDFFSVSLGSIAAAYVVPQVLKSEPVLLVIPVHAENVPQ